MKAITAREAEKIARIKGVDLSGDGLTFYATNEKENEIYSFDTKRERTNFVKAYNEKYNI